MRGSATGQVPSRTRVESRGRDIAVDDLLDLLGHRRRRMVLGYCASEPFDEVAVEALADQIRAWETAVGVEASNHYDGVLRSLYQIHLPKLDALGVIEWATEDGTVRYRRWARVEHLLDVVNQLERWP